MSSQRVSKPTAAVLGVFAYLEKVMQDLLHPKYLRSEMKVHGELLSE